jgi:hypothetical protein
MLGGERMRSGVQTDALATAQRKSLDQFGSTKSQVTILCSTVTENSGGGTLARILSENKTCRSSRL